MSEGWVTFQIRTARRVQLLDITDRVAETVERSRVPEGVCHLFVGHTTRGGVTNGTDRARGRSRLRWCL